jgi:TetR/AcrR family transcriptional regulator, transcriptional repressor for nem operon
VKNEGSTNSSDRILAAATRIAQAHGYGGLNMRELAEVVGIRAASVYHHFPSKGDLAAAVARRYWEDAGAYLDAMWAESGDASACLHEYPSTFRRALENENRICLCSFMAAEIDDLPEPVKVEVQAFAEVNVAWIKKLLIKGRFVAAKEAEARARAIFAAIAGAQLMARSRSDIGLYDTLVAAYRTAGLLPA